MKYELLRSVAFPNGDDVPGLRFDIYALQEERLADIYRYGLRWFGRLNRYGLKLFCSLSGKEGEETKCGRCSK